MGKVTGIGGVFIKFKDPKKMKVWYKEVLGVETNDYGVLFSFNGNDHQKGYLQLGTFPENSDYFGSASQQVMINFRVERIFELIELLKSRGVTILDEIETYPYGSFVHIADPEGNRIELWEPVDSEFDSEIQQVMY